MVQMRTIYISQVPPLFAASVFEVGVTCRQLSADKHKIKTGRSDIALPLLTIERKVWTKIGKSICFMFQR